MKRKAKWLDIGTRDRFQELSSQRVWGYNPGYVEDGKRMKDWIYCDIKKMEGFTDDDLVCDATKIDDFVEADSVEILECKHTMEHFNYRAMQDIVDRFYKIMKKDSKIFVEVPNAQFHISLAMEGRFEEAQRYALGGHVDADDYHQAWFFPQTITKHLEAAGFKNITVRADKIIFIMAEKQ